MKKEDKKVQRIKLEGNNGADRIVIEQTEKQAEEGVCFIEIGQCCVYILSAIVPIEFITSLFGCFMERNFGTGEWRNINDKLEDVAKEIITYNDEEYNKKLIKKIKRVSWIDGLAERRK